MYSYKSQIPMCMMVTETLCVSSHVGHLS